MFDRQIQNFTQKPLIIIAKLFLKFLKPNQMTILGFILGFFMCILIFFQFYFAALALLLLNRFCDGLDGTMARLTTPTPLGGYLDIVSDFTIYSGFVLAFGFSNSSYTTLSMILLFLYIGTGTTFLAKAAIQTQLDKISETNDAIEGSYHQTRTHFGNFYSVRTVDIDGDGDYDIVPDQYANWGTIPYVSNLHWEKVGNKYIRRYTN